MNTIYLIRHSIKDKTFNEFLESDTKQQRNEKLPLNEKGKEMALKLAESTMLEQVNEIWASNYLRAQQTAKYICDKNNLKLNFSPAFDERHYGDIDSSIDKEEFWIEQFKNKDLKYPNGESQNDVANRMHEKIEEILKNKDNKKIAIVAHNACILFYIMKFCKLEKAYIPKKLTISYNDKKIINDEIMDSPSIIELKIDSNKIIDINYYTI